MTVLVTGATGKTGVELIQLLEKDGVPFVAAVRAPNDSSSTPQVWFDWTDRSSWASALQGVDSVYLVKPVYGPTLGETVTDFLRQAMSVRRVVLLSEMVRDSKPDSDPERAAEIAVELSGMEWTILRPSWFFQNFGPGGGYAEHIRTRSEIELPASGATVSLVDTRDVADVAYLALTEDGHSGHCYDLTGPKDVSITDVTATISFATGRPITHVSTTLGRYRQQLESGGLAPDRVNYLMDLNTDLAEGRFAKVTGTHESLTGRAPRTLADFVEEYASFWSA